MKIYNFLFTSDELMVAAIALHESTSIFSIFIIIKNNKNIMHGPEKMKWPN